MSANGAVPPAQRSETPDTTVIQQSGDSPVDSTFLPQTVFQVQMGVVSTETREETLICDVLRNRYFRMNVTGAFIWGQIGVEANFQSICMQLQRNYELSATVADGVLMDFMRDVVDAEIVVASTVER